jgi:hypothetical protein
MASNRDKKPKRRSGSRWFDESEHFGIRDSELYSMGDNAKLKHSKNKIKSKYSKNKINAGKSKYSKNKINAGKLTYSKNEITAGIMIMVDCLTGGSHEVDQGEANSLYDDYRR